MSEKVFLYRENTDDRDALKYIDLRNKFECGHYFVGVRLSGAAFSGRDVKKVDYDDITTLLTREEFDQLKEFDFQIGRLGYGIVLGDEKYQKGVTLYAGIQSIIEKLQSEENDEFFKKVLQAEYEELKEEHGLTDEDIIKIFEYTEYKEKGNIACIFNSIEEAAREEAFSLGYVNDQNERWFNFEAFGQDLLDDERYIELEDGRVVYLYEV